MKVVVTGAGGFIGFHLVKKLCAQMDPRDITCLIRSTGKEADLKALGVRVVHADLRKKETLVDPCRDAEMIFHLAACVRYGIQGGTDFESDNNLGTVNLLEVCPPTLRLFLYMSSINAVERPAGDACKTLLNEESVCAPQTPYGKSKLAGEEAVKKILTPKKIPYLIVRPPSLVYGPGASPQSGMNRILAGVAQKSLLMSLNFPGRFSIIHVQDLVEATWMLVSSQSKNETFFVADSRPYALSEITAEAARQMNVQRNGVSLPSFLYKIGNIFLDLLAKVANPPLQLLMLMRDQAAVDVSKARKAGWSSRISLAEGIRSSLSERTV